MRVTSRTLCGVQSGARYQVSPETMSSLPSLSTSKTPAASNALLALMACFFHVGSPPRAAARPNGEDREGGQGGADRGHRSFSSGMVGFVDRSGASRPPFGTLPGGQRVVVSVRARRRRRFGVVGVDFPAQGARGGLDDAGGGRGVGVGQLEVDRRDVAPLEHGVAAERGGCRPPASEAPGGLADDGRPGRPASRAAPPRRRAASAASCQPGSASSSIIGRPGSGSDFGQRPGRPVLLAGEVAVRLLVVRDRAPPRRPSGASRRSRGRCCPGGRRW